MSQQELIIKYVVYTAAAFGAFQLYKILTTSQKTQQVLIKDETQPGQFIPTQVTFQEQKNPLMYIASLIIAFLVLAGVYRLTQKVEGTGIYQQGEQMLKQRGFL